VAALGREDVRKPVFGFVTSGSRPLLRDYTWSEWKDPFASVGRNGGGRIAVEAADAIAALNQYTNSSLVIEAQMGQLMPSPPAHLFEVAVAEVPWEVARLLH